MYTNRTIRNRALSVFTSLALMASLCIGLTISASATGLTKTLTASDFTSNVYVIAATSPYDTFELSGTLTGKIIDVQKSGITIDGQNMTRVSGVSTPGTAYTDLTIDCTVPGITLNLKDLYAVNNANSGSSPIPGGYVAPGSSLLRFTGAGNVLNIVGDCLLESTSYVSYAGIAVNSGTELTITGTTSGVNESRLYMYKYSQGCGIGADANKANGKITIASGNILIKGSKTGAIIGNDTAGNATEEAKIGDISITGGNIALATMSQGAAIGGSRMSIAGHVSITGGSVFILSDFTGSAIGAGAQKNSVAANNGTLTLGTGASLKVVRTGNSLYGNSDPTQYLNDTLVKDALANGGTALRQCEIPVSGSSVTITEEVDDGAGSTMTQTLYSGPNPVVYPFTASTTTIANWGTPTNGYVYIYLTQENHDITVNGTTTYSCVWNGDGFTVS